MKTQKKKIFTRPKMTWILIDSRKLSFPKTLVYTTSYTANKNAEKTLIITPRIKSGYEFLDSIEEPARKINTNPITESTIETVLRTK